MKKIFLLLLLLTKNLLSIEVYLDAIKYADKDFFNEKSNQITITETDIKKLNPKNLSELLKIHNVDLYSRSNIQQDFSLRGNTFEQTKILLDGIPLNDPQTGHHNCNIPISLENIKEIQIIKSGDLSFYGNNAFGGVINIKTKDSTANSLSITYGSFDTYKINSNTNLNTVLISFDSGGSNGYRNNTDYNYYNTYTKFNYKDYKFSFGYLTKYFGAQDFYASNRIEYEETKTFFGSITKNFLLSKNLNLDINIFTRNGYDYYTTQRYRPELYNNKHFSQLHGIQWILNFAINKNFTIQPFVETTFKKLDSKGSSSALPTWKGMGKFDDEEYSLSTKFVFNTNKFLIESTVREYYLIRYGFLPQYSTMINFYPTLSSNFFVSASKVFRTPSYTELFYWDPNHETSQELKIEKTNEYSAGFSKKFDKINFSISGYYYEPTNVIDWARTKNTNQSWKITNLSKVESYGTELTLDSNILELNTKIIYSFNTKNFDLPENIEFKYIENYPKNSLSFILFFPEFFGLKTNLTNIYKNYTKTTPTDFSKMLLVPNFDLNNT